VVLSTGEVPVRWYEAERTTGAAAGPTLLWLHGGGFFRGGLDQPEAHAVARALAARGLTVATVDYRLAPVPLVGRQRPGGGRPRVRFPLPLEDVVSAHREVRRRSPGGVLLGGASAGACLAAAATLRALDDGTPPVGAVFAYGFFHARHPRVRDPAVRSRGHRRVTHAPWALDVANRNYAGSRRALAQRHAFPGGHDLHGFPPALLVHAEHDTMRASGDRFAAELAGAGADVERHVLPGTRHAFLDRPGLAEFGTTMARIAAWSARR
jgi:acetyl esterase/lipase